MQAAVFSKPGEPLAIKNVAKPEISDDEIPNFLKSSVKKINKKVYDTAFENNVGGEAGTTLVSVIIKDSSLYWISIGDSRMYLYRNGSIKQLTVDHIYANHLIMVVDVVLNTLWGGIFGGVIGWMLGKKNEGTT